MAGAGMDRAPVGDVDDVGGTLLADILGKGLGQEKGRFEVDVEMSIPVTFGRVVPAAWFKDRGTVDQDVRTTEGSHGTINDRGCLGRLAEVGLDGCGLAPQ